MKKIIQYCMAVLFLICGFQCTKAYAAGFTDAVPIQVNQTVTGNVTEGYSKEKDYYTFTTTYPGSVTVHFANPMQNSSSEYWRVVLYDWEYKELLTEYIYGNKTTTDLTDIGIPAGTYYVKVESASDYKAQSSDSYDLRVSYTMSDSWEKEFNENFTTATVVSQNMSYFGTTSSGYDYEKDYYCIELEEAGSLTVNFSNPLQRDTSEYWHVNLYDDEYTQIYSGYIYGNAASTNLPATGLDAGKYYIRVESASYL